MGLLDGTSYEGYLQSGQPGTYQFTSLNNIINAFMTVYVGESKLLSKVSRTDVQFYAMRAIQELSYDVFRSIKAQEFVVPPSLSFLLPQDYVNYVKIVRVDSNGIERVLYPTGKTSNPTSLIQDADGDLVLNSGGYLTESPTSQTLTNWNSQTPNPDVYSDDTSDIEIDNRGRRYGLDPQHAQSNGTFFIDYGAGKFHGNIHFSSALANQTVILKYVSDGLGTDSEMVVHKFCEEACYKWIAYGILSSRSNIPEGIVQRFKKEKFAETRKAKIRLSNIKIEEFTQVLKGLSKPIK
tara:strand:+ start:1883 stop:2767 length:885 start_codon:yes stop_codon:yes gene_type:complete